MRLSGNRRASRISTGTLLAVFLLLAQAAIASIPVYGTYKFQRNRERAVRKDTRFIILHTTEGPTKGSGEKLKRNGEAHYMVDPQGRVYEIVNVKRVAYHCGLSMWNGRTGLDDCSIGIEMVGYHDKDLTQEQIKTLKELLAELRRKYPSVTDDRVLTHSMVAYGAPNHWYKRNHRGRKRCGMKMADDVLRKNLGINSKPSYDPDVKARRLIVADKELHTLLYARRAVPKTKPKPPTQQQAQNKKPQPSPQKQVAPQQPELKRAPDVIGPGRSAWDIAKSAYNSADTLYVFPDGTMKTGAEIKDWKSMKAGTKVFMKIDGATHSSALPAAVSTLAGDAAKSLLGTIAGENWDSTNTFYVAPTGQYFSGAEINATNLATLAEGSRILSGYRIAGRLEQGVVLWSLCQDAWNRPETYYLLPSGTLISGDKVNASKIPLGTTVFVKETK